MTLPNKNKFDPAFPITDKDSRPSQFYRDYLIKLDALVASLAAGNTPSNLVIPTGNLVNAANDAAAAGLGVGLFQMYRNGSVLMIRVV